MPNNKFSYAIIFLAVYVCIVSTLIFWKQGNALPKNLSPWQAVFLTDGQVYFGHLEKYNQNFDLLTTIYYLKYGSTLQENGTSADASAGQNLNLIKLGGEVHGPEDMMYIPTDKILFIENLKSTSQVVQAIEKNK